MPSITVQPSGKIYQTSSGISILAALLAGGETIAHKCDGKAECGSCHISVIEGRKSVSKIKPAENERLDMTVGVGSKSRLACQTIVGEEDLIIEILSV
ncbi:MAG: 2Fe-2S iron-sulfur cluster-binding protein [Methylotenera sp.]|uniref:2Fe-2S iron-sulfur cluster-binding protein n=1 Tax=Methylotenera sp. TaxID=2051956 RepID=UPI0024871797|nr:2Fe-2S iron-sulfur cluster-binding protein [Methylotenera sp.]MDI1310417.1 2Fe-2S iron-sulfur cluster-binding protein [Methylotenera sp.]